MHFAAKGKVRILYVLADLIFVSLSFLTAYYLKYKNIALWQDSNYEQYQLLFLVWFMLLTIFLARYKLFMTRRMMGILSEVLRVFKAVCFSSVLVSMALFLFKFDFFSRKIFALAAAFIFLSLSLWRVVKRCIVRYLVANGYKNYKVLIVGAGTCAEELLDELEANKYLGLNVIGLLDDSKTGDVQGCQILGTLDEFEQIVCENFIDEVFVTIPSVRNKILSILETSAKLKKNVRIMPETYGNFSKAVDITRLGVLPLITYHERPIYGFQLKLKRFFDIFASLLGILILSPILAVIAILIKLDSKGPVFYVSKRSGFKGETFGFWKFRTMVVDAEQQKVDLMDQNEVDGGGIFKIRKDPRITKLGAFLRKYSLDELPQLFNVLKGDMSLVGPRPFPVCEFKEFDAFHKARAEIKPGITGLAQIRGRSDLTFIRWIKWDLWYVSNWSFWLDIVILWRTLPVVIKGKGAY